VKEKKQIVTINPTDFKADKCEFKNPVLTLLKFLPQNYKLIEGLQEGVYLFIFTLSFFKNLKVMRKKRFYLFIVIAIALVLIFRRSCNHTLAASYFDKDSEDWSIVGDAQNGTGQPDYQKEGGNPGGFLSADDNRTGGVWYWNAPEKFLGDMSAAYNGKLSFSLKQSSTENQFDADDIILFGNDKKIVLDTPNNPDTSWTNYSVKLSEDAGWKYNDANGEKVSKEDFNKILAKLSAINIRGEFVDGADTGSLDNVVISSK